MSQILTSDEIARRQQALDSTWKRCQSYETEAAPEPPAAEQADSESRSREAAAQVMQHSHWQINTELASKRADYNKICLICLSGSPQFNRAGRSGELVTPCLCVGKRSHYHRACIESWIELTGVSSCPFCLVRYEFTKERRSFVDFVQASGLEREFCVGLSALLVSAYLLSVGLTICCDYLFAIYYKCDDLATYPNETLLAQDNWKELEKLVDCYRTTQELADQHSWPSTLLFCFVSISTVLLLITTVSTSLSILLRYYIKYLIWNRTNFRVRIEPYRLEGTPCARR